MTTNDAEVVALAPCWSQD